MKKLLTIILLLAITVAFGQYQIKDPVHIVKHGKSISHIVCKSMEEPQINYAHPDFNLKTNCLILSFPTWMLNGIKTGDTIIITRDEITMKWEITTKPFEEKVANPECVDCNSPYYQQYMVTVKNIYKVNPIKN